MLIRDILIDLPIGSGGSTKPLVSRRIVHGCSDCPMCDMNDMCAGYSCRLDSDNRIIKEDKKFNAVTPAWCPLKVAPLLIEYGG